MDPLRYAQLARDRQAQIVSALPPEARTVRALTEVGVQLSAPGGCHGCKSRRLLKWLAREIEQAPGPEKLVVDSVVNKV